MTVLFCVLCVILLAAFLWQRRSYKKLQEEVCYIGERLRTLSITSENGFVLLPTDHGCMKKMVSSINGLLQEFYSGKLEYERAKKAMAQVLTNISHDIRTPLTVFWYPGQKTEMSRSSCAGWRIRSMRKQTSWWQPSMIILL